MIRFHCIEKSYSLGTQSVPALSGVYGVIQRAEMVALCGPSGSGKSTLLNICGLLDMDYQGELFFNNMQMPREPIAAAEMRRSQMGFIFQRFNLIPVMTALENVAYPLQLNKVSKAEQIERATEMLSKVGLEKFIHHRPDHLSGGQQQRVAIARALVHKPALVIADEPTASLDSKTANTVIDLMRELGHEYGTTFIVATHDMRMAQRCDRTINLVDGKVQKEELSWVS